VFTIAHKFKSIVLSLAVLLCGTLVASQEQRPLVAVLEPAASSGVTPLQKSLVRGELEETLSGSGKYRLVDRGFIDRALEEHSIARTALFDNNTVKELGKWLQADLVCASEIIKEGGDLIFNCKLINIETGEIIGKPFSDIIKSDSNTEIRKLVELAGMTLSGTEDPREAQARKEAEDELTRRKIADLEEQKKLASERVAKQYAEADKARRDREATENATRLNQMRAAATKDRIELARVAGDDTVTPTQENIRAAKLTVNKLMPGFTFKNSSSGVSFVSKSLPEYEKTQRESHLKIRENAIGWYILVPEVKNGKLFATSIWRYRPTSYQTRGEGLMKSERQVHAGQSGLAFEVYHNTLSINSSNMTITSQVDMKRNQITDVWSLANGLFTEEGPIKEPGPVLYAIVAENRRPIRVKLSGARSKDVDLNDFVVNIIDQTLELHEAVIVLRKAGERIREKYRL